MITRILDGGLDPLFALPDSPFRQTHCRKGREPLRDVHLNLYYIGIDSDDGATEDFG
jgi:hypothetical protein